MSSDFLDFVTEAPAGADPWTSPPGEPATRAIAVGGSPSSCLRIGRWQPEQLRQARGN
ncbi:hypothetical protein GCM10010404_54570 [Nonomuraea africana]|uniref:Uncharacterized protein n=1 Tax=Nonomuraea africana TaxID=46171 RepID=A0ABR9K5T8_9ACTN|nr:hypothetical protein [Nonomuraea africana]MBE1557384.1 hypothetical protein [Nonomuraea africana]